MNEIAAALRAIAGYQREQLDGPIIVPTPRMLTPDEKAARKSTILDLIGELETLAADAEVRPIAHDEFFERQRRFLPLGKPVPQELTSAVARAITAAQVQWQND